MRRFRPPKEFRLSTEAATSSDCSPVEGTASRPSQWPEQTNESPSTDSGVVAEAETSGHSPPAVCPTTRPGKGPGHGKASPPKQLPIVTESASSDESFRSEDSGGPADGAAVDCQQFILALMQRNEKIADQAFAAQQEVMKRVHDPWERFEISQDAGKAVNLSVKNLNMLIGCREKLTPKGNQP